MKYINWILLMFILLTKYLFSDPCSDCKNKEFMYHFCKDGKLYEKCSSDPLNEPGLKFN
jgi:hypothetical protein